MILQSKFIDIRFTAIADKLCAMGKGVRVIRFPIKNGLEINVRRQKLILPVAKDFIAD